MNNLASNRRIAKNTLILYTRSLLSMLIAIFASRIVLNALGVVDYGIYNIVGGVIATLSFLNSALNTSSQRFINYELGRGDIDSLNRVFSMSLTVHLLVAFIIFVLAESVGLWFVNHELQIPYERMGAANWVYQCAVILSVATIAQTPYTASMIANERMAAFASIGILDVLFRLSIAIIISLVAIDRLYLYAILMMIFGVVKSLLYVGYCKMKLEGCSYKFTRDRLLFNEMITFSGWNLFGAASLAVSTQGINILFNLFFGVVVNAAQGITTQLLSAISGLVSNFQIAMNPQIIQSYSMGEACRFNTLIFTSAKVSFYLLLLISAPILCNTEYILTIWLKNVPEYVVPFCQIAIVTTIINSFSLPLLTGVTSCGDIKLYQIVLGTAGVMLLPLTYLAIKLGASPIVASMVTTALTCVTLIIRLLFAQRLIEVNFARYLGLITRALGIATTTIGATFILKSTIHNATLAFIVTSLFVTMLTSLLVYLLHTNSCERAIIAARFKQLRLTYENKCGGRNI